MPTVTQIEDGLRAWVLAAISDVVGDRVIFADQGEARPERPYADVDVGAIEQRGRDEWRGVDADGLRDVTGPRAVRVTVQVYGPDAMELAERARAALWRETVGDTLRSAGIVFYNAEPVLDITTEIETDLEPRAAFDALFGVASLQTENVGVIECVEGTGTYRNADGSLALVVPFDVCATDATLTEDGEPLTEDGEPLTEGP